MDILQVALVLLILLLMIFLSVLGVQVFFILRDLKKAAEKMDQMMGSASQMVSDVEKPVEAVTTAVETGAQLLADLVDKPKKRKYFKH